MSTVAFDVIGTLFSLDRPREVLTSMGAPPLTLELWFAESLREAFALSHSGGYRPFAEVLGSALERLLPSVVEGPDVSSRVMDAMRELDPAPGAEQAIDRFSEAEWRLLTLTNGSEESTRSLLRRLDREDRFAAVLSCDDVRTTKPHQRVYELAKNHADGELWLVAAHAWDVSGAARAGLRTAWVPSVEGRYLSIYPEPDVTASDLAAAADRILSA